jgi:hypothetical protein
MSRMRQTIAQRLKASQNAAAFLTTFQEIDMSSLQDFRKLYKDGVLKNEGVKLGFMSAFARAACLALKEIPAANASIDGDQIVYRDYVDLSVAVSTPKGLVVPVVRNAESMGLVDIEKAIAGLAVKARDNKLGLEDMSGGTFTISNGGVFGSLFGTPMCVLSLLSPGIIQILVQTGAYTDKQYQPAPNCGPRYPRHQGARGRRRWPDCHSPHHDCCPHLRPPTARRPRVGHHARQD